MKTLLTTLLLLIMAPDYDGPYSAEYYKDKEELISNLKSLSDEQLMAMNSLTISTKYLYFDMADTTFEYQNIFEVDTIIGGTQITAEFHRKYGPFNLKELSVRNQLRADPIVRPVLDRLGQFTYNQFTNF